MSVNVLYPSSAATFVSKSAQRQATGFLPHHQDTTLSTSSTMNTNSMQ
jgi:hypothetical protein